uniref:Uncharacterized protein n=1 Tax=Caldiarchaeum subterraneum TaxID=311458 RepID=E6N3K9_CALS0|nr:hypothetical protein HGMM_F30F06C41 [Candidatus Caldarchaeum subterraneum]
MPKMFSKTRALETIIRVGEELAKLAEEKGLREMVVGRGELRMLLNKQNRRGKSILTLAIQRFAASQMFTTPRWTLEVADPVKPLLIYRRR